MMGQTATICPADKKLYALRDVTATVPSRPLIVASILSKKLAESLDALVLDVKFGSGAFMKTREDAVLLGEAMREVGTAMGVETRVCYHPMDEPTAGPWATPSRWPRRSNVCAEAAPRICANWS